MSSSSSSSSSSHATIWSFSLASLSKWILSQEIIAATRRSHRNAKGGEQHPSDDGDGEVHDNDKVEERIKDFLGNCDDARFTSNIVNAVEEAIDGDG